MSVHQSLRSKACLAEHPNHQTAVAAALHIWEMHVGTVQLFIIGPGPHAWLACSESYYSGQVGTDEERNIARRAVILLNREQLQNKDAGPAEIRAALQRARKQGEPVPSCEIAQPDSEPDPTPVADVVPPAIPTRKHERVRPFPLKPDELEPGFDSILATVSRITGISSAEILSTGKPRPIIRARFLAIAAVMEIHPRITQEQLAALFQRCCHGSVSNALEKHAARMAADSSYARDFDVILDSMTATA